MAVPVGEVGGGSLSPGVGLQSMLARCSKPRLELEEVPTIPYLYLNPRDE